VRVRRPQLHQGIPGAAYQHLQGARRRLQRHSRGQRVGVGVRYQLNRPPSVLQEGFLLRLQHPSTRAVPGTHPE
jgi:hypothetical protein